MLIRLPAQVASLVASEFFEQGDIERNQLNIKPMVRRRDTRTNVPRMYTWQSTEAMDREQCIRENICDQNCSGESNCLLFW